MLMPLGHEEMSPVQLALEVALHELTALDGLHVTDMLDVEYKCDIDTKEATELLEEALEPFRLSHHKKILMCENGHYLGEAMQQQPSEKYCPDCGAEVLSKCPNCGEPLRRNKNVIFTKYCTACGEMYPWWTEGKMTLSPMSPEEEELLQKNLSALEILEKLHSYL